MSADLDVFRQSFFDEAVEHLATMEAALLELERAPSDREILDRIFRAAHSIKGGSGMFGLDDLARFTHVLESVLERVREGRLECTRALADLLLGSLDVLKTVVAAAQDGGPPPALFEEALAELGKVLALAGGAAEATGSHAAPDGPASTRRLEVSFAPDRDLLRRGTDPLRLLRELSECGRIVEVVAGTSSLPPLGEMDPESCYLSWSIVLETDRSLDDVRSVFSFVEDSSQVEIRALMDAALPGTSPPRHELEPQGAEPAKERPEASSIRVATDKVDKIMNLVGELVIAHSMILEAARSGSLGAVARVLETAIDLERTTRDLQERVMEIRMVPIASIFGRIPRVVRDLAPSLGKEVVLEVTGDDTKLDKSVIEGLGDPLTHLIRNAIDHGIESPEERRLAGKAPHGTLELSASYEGGSVIVEVQDDGRGLDTDRIRAKAIARGLIRADDDLTESQLHELVLVAGFSTAENVSAVSGRGVGLDVVKRNVEALAGTLTIESEKGRGARFRLRLPLTLAILDGLLLRVGEQTYVIPLVSVVESFRPRPEDVKALLGRGEVVLFRGVAVPLIRLGRVLGAPESAVATDRGLIVIVETGGQRLGIAVDELLGQAQAVVKSLETNFRRVDGIIGATILGDGRVALILDVEGVARLARGHAVSKKKETSHAPSLSVN